MDTNEKGILMEQDKNMTKKPASDTTIFRNMMIAIFSVAAIFFCKNLFTKSFSSAILIGLCLIAFTFIVIIMRKLNLDQDKQQFTLCICLVLLVFCISLNSGSYYSDDFPLYLAVIGLSGLYLVPKYALAQTILIDIALVLSYVIHPEKADPLPQYLTCMLLFTIAAFIIYVLIKRGRSYIELAKIRAQEAERLLSEFKNAGEELRHNCDTSVQRITLLEEANERLETSAAELKSGSSNITQDTLEVTETFEDVQVRMQTTETQIHALNTEVKKVEESLAENRRNMQEMTSEMETLRSTVESTDKVFSILQEQMQEISAVTEQLTKIASSTTMLALNASIEAARAGHMGAGFAVVASKVQDLAEDSSDCSVQVVSVVNNMQQRIEETTKQLTDSTNAINHSIESLQGFQEGFDQLTLQFNSLYQNIEEQNENVHQMDTIFNDLKGKISDMTISSETNQHSVDSMNEVIHVYKENIDMVINDNKLINNLSNSMLELSQTQIEQP